MKVTIPIYVVGKATPELPGRRYVVRPLFFPNPTREHEKLSRAMGLLAEDLHRHLRHLGKQLRHDDLAAWTFCPEVKSHRLDLTLELKHRRIQCRFLFVAFPFLDRRVAFTPS